MKYCSQCGEGVIHIIPEGDNRHRHVCTECGYIHYDNPKMVVGCIPEWEDKILLCKRAIEPRYGLWTLPAGYMENAETTAEAAARETMEEAGANVDILHLFAMFSLPHINQVYLMYRASMPEAVYSAGAESLDVGLYREADIPWENIAFPVITETLKLYFEDRLAGGFKTHTGNIYKVSSSPPRYRVEHL